MTRSPEPSTQALKESSMSHQTSDNPRTTPRSTSSDHIRTVTSGTFNARVLEAKGPIAVEFMSYGCVHCRELEPVLQQVAEMVKSKGTIFRANTADDQELTISNDPGHCKSFFSLYYSHRAHFFLGAGIASGSHVYLCHPKSLSLYCSSFWCCPPVISSITNDHDEFFDLPFQGGGWPNQSAGDFAP